ncbi:unnamed protein product [Urochloa decumbens]|uniref:Uncharacterized protein n=1 Tax=Urochloa decumbens TaxID=240449 RepID=A0ABC9GEL1_9POAL
MVEYVAQKGLKPDIESLSKELVMMNAAMEDASQVPPEQLTRVEKLWARNVRELSYDMEDVVDDFILRVTGGNYETATDVNVLKKILGKATAMMKKVKDRHQISNKVKDIKKLSNELAQLRAKYTIRGAGANFAASTGIDPRVLNDMLKTQFGCSAFISVGRTPNLTGIFEKMLVGLDKNYKQVDMARWDIERFGNELHEFLQHKRYFIVVDDIWDVGSWEAIRYALKDNNCGSRIIMTTRNFEVATKVKKVYRLKPLSDGNSRRLFYKRIQSQEGESLDAVSGELSSKIIDKCGGIPLAIIAIASLLVERPCEDWSKVYDSIGFGDGDDNTTKILSCSYYDLPAYLKPILLHLSIFPEDYIFDTKSMIWMWIAEGFVHLEKKEGSLFEVGERYFKELVNRSMIQQTEDKGRQYFEEFRIHDIVLDLIRKLLKDEDFITILDSREQHSSLDSLSREKKTGMTQLEGKTLILVDTGLDELPPAVCLLTQLMCLNASGFKRFPADRMGNLTSLEQLWLERVVGRNATEDLVVALGKLTRLRLVTIVFSEGLDESLQQGLVQSLRNLQELKELYLISEGLSHQGATVLEDWEAPRQLLRLVIIGITFSRLPRWINRSRLPCLLFLYLQVYVVEVEDLDKLARLPELSHLELRGSRWPPGYTVSTDSFKNLRLLELGRI